MRNKEIETDIVNIDELNKKELLRMSRRTFMKMAAMTAGAVALTNTKLIDKAMASALVPGQVPFPGASILKYVDTLPVFGPASITPANPLGIPRVNGSMPVSVIMQPWSQQILSTGTVLPAGPVGTIPPGSTTPIGLTNVWAYNVNGVTNYPTVTIEATKGTPTNVTYVNNLTPNANYPTPMYNYLTVDQTLHWADPQMNMPQTTPYTGPVPAVVHLHGGEVPPHFDGGPDAWWTPGKAQTGHAFVTDVYNYPNVQESTTLFFHDHALGVTRLNVHAGLVGFYFIRDAVETAVTPPLPTGKYEIEIAIQDKMFDNTGQILFPDVGVNPGTHPFWVPEFFGDSIVVNGKTWPYLVVEPRRYRLRFVNGSNARFYNLKSKVEFWQIGTDGGLLDTPVKVNNLLLGPGERADVIVDFSREASKTKVKNMTITNNAATPYPVGLPVVKGTTDQILQFRVQPLPAVPVVDPSFNPRVNKVLRGAGNTIVRLVNPTTGTLAAGVTPTMKRSLTLNEWLDPVTLLPLEMLLNNTKWNGLQVNTSVPGSTPVPRPDFTEIPAGSGIYYSEIVQEGTTEIWEIINLTVDAHPIHLHLVQFQLLNRQVMDTVGYQAAYAAAFPGGAWIPEYGPPNPYNTVNPAGYIGGNPDVTPFLIDPVTLAPSPIIPPNKNESGWKDTVVMLPGQVTRIAVRFAPLDKPIADPNLYYPFNPNGGHGYVWHCHIIDHEDNEMMRPYSVTPATVLAPAVVITDAATGLPPTTGTVGTPITLTGTPTYAPGLTGNIVWTGVDPAASPISFAPGPTPNTVSFTPTLLGTYTITATVTDSRGNIGSATVTIVV